MTVGSRRIVFRPGPVRPGIYSFDVGTAGSVTLIVQALLPPLALAPGPSRVTLRGGTHVPWSPPYHYLSEVFLPTVSRMGVKADLDLKRWGWYPKGGGEVEVIIQPSPRLTPLVQDQSWKPDEVKVLCAASNLPGHIGEREKQRLAEILRPRGLRPEFEVAEGPAVGQGNIVFIAARKGPAAAGFSALGARGRPAEQGAEEAAGSFLSFLDSDAAVDEHLGDQLLPYLALAVGRSGLLVHKISSHLRTNLWVIHQFMPERLTLMERQGLAGITNSIL
jgi:RNA 3'-phosphate cyclase